MRSNLLTDMVNITPFTTRYNIDFVEGGTCTYFDDAQGLSIVKNIFTNNKDTEHSSYMISATAAINARRNRERVLGFTKADGSDKYRGWGQKFVAGDIMRLNVERGPYAHLLEGLCLGIKKRSFLDKDTVILIRNVLFGVGVEITASYYNNRLYKCGFSDYKRKQFAYMNHKLYYLRYRDNRETQV